MTTLEIFFVFLMSFLACTGAWTIGTALANVFYPDKLEEAKE